MTGAHDASASLLAMITAHTGFTLAGARGACAREAIRDEMARAGIADLGSYLARLTADASALEELTAAILVGETYFLREPEQWRLVRDTILPEIVERQGPGHVIRCWSAGCASGEEAYSLAIVLREAELLARSDLVGTDLSPRALAQAREARYTAWSLRAVPAGYIERWFHRAGDGHALDAAIRDRVAFRQLNLVTDRYPSPESGIGQHDLILCRNVLLYFDRQLRARVVGKLHAALAPGGWLICGSSDPSPLPDAPLEPVVTAHGMVYRRPLAPEPDASSPGLPGLPAPDDGDPGLAWAEPGVAGVAAWPGEDAGAVRSGSPSAAAAATEQPRGDAPWPAQRHAELDPGRHYSRAMALVDGGRYHEAVIAIRNVLYLDRTLAVAHFTLGVLLERIGDLAKAWRCYRNAAAAAARRRLDEAAPLGSGETHRTIAIAARRRADQIAARSDRPDRPERPDRPDRAGS